MSLSVIHAKYVRTASQARVVLLVTSLAVNQQRSIQKNTLKSEMRNYTRCFHFRGFLTIAGRLVSGDLHKGTSSRHKGAHGNKHIWQTTNIRSSQYSQQPAQNSSWQQAQEADSKHKLKHQPDSNSTGRRSVCGGFRPTETKNQQYNHKAIALGHLPNITLSPHLQTAFLHFYGRPPIVIYKWQLFCTHDGGTVVLDWLLASDVAEGSDYMDKSITQDDTTLIVVVIPGLISDSVSPYLKHLTYSLAKQGQNMMVSNHHGLADISITFDCFYNAGWTEDIREVINYLHQKYPKANLFAVGTSVGANILVKYLGEDEGNTPIAGAASICSPWDLVVCDIFLNRKPIQQFYNRALTIGLKDYAKLYEHVLTRLVNWEGIKQDIEPNFWTEVFFSDTDYFWNAASSNFYAFISARDW
ncbi:uncharacterized protein LOC141813073 [Curcuma longa]|uniref:uncharacterized protein LOC141813073 n=1 Tax=Curcuma longa TaxID=136217 RepID=UPI003D9EC33B